MKADHKITTKIAWMLRKDMGLLLNPSGDYEDSRVKEIAKRQSEIISEMNALDEELRMLAGD